MQFSLVIKYKGVVNCIVGPNFPIFYPCPLPLSSEFLPCWKLDLHVVIIKNSTFNRARKARLDKGEKNGTKSVAAKVSANPTGSSGAWMALQKCFELGHGVRSLYCHTWPVTACGWPVGAPLSKAAAGRQWGREIRGEGGSARIRKLRGLWVFICNKYSKRLREWE